MALSNCKSVLNSAKNEKSLKSDFNQQLKHHILNYKIFFIKMNDKTFWCLTLNKWQKY